MAIRISSIQRNKSFFRDSLAFAYHLRSLSRHEFTIFACTHKGEDPHKGETHIDDKQCRSRLSTLSALIGATIITCINFAQTYASTRE